MNAKKKLTLIGVLFAVVGIIFATAGIVVMVQGNSLEKRCTEEAIGTVVEITCETSYSETENQYTYTYYPVIEYQVGDRIISQKSRTGQYPPKYQVGEQVEIYFNPNNVEEYFIKGDSTPKFLGIGFIILGTIAVVVGFFAFIRNAGKSVESSDSELYRY